MDEKAIRAGLAGRDYGRLETLMAAANLAELALLWPALAPLEKLVLFKLLDAPRALEFYARLPFNEKYFLLCGFPLQAVAPVLEGLPPAERRRFVQLPREFYDRMFRQLVSERVEMTVPLENN